MAAAFDDPDYERYKRAAADRQKWDAILDDAYRFAIPNHDPRGGDTAGQKRNVDVYDSTAVTAVNERAARLHGLLYPPFKEFQDFATDGDDTNLEDVEDGEAKTALKKYIETAKRRFHAAVDRSNFHIEIHPTLKDCQISVGAILVHEGTPSNPLRFEAVPVAQVIPEEGDDGIIRNAYRRFQVKGRNIKTRWRDAKLPSDLAEKVKDAPDEEHTFVEATIHDPDRNRYRYIVWLDGNSPVRVVERKYKSSPWVVFRNDKAPGETMGRGAVLDCLPDIQVANKVVELVLLNAAFAISGIWQAEDDGVLNPATVKIAPGAIIPKGAGQGLTPLTPGARFDVSQLLLTDLRQKITRTIMGPSLPPDEEAGKATAYEVSVRQRTQESIEVPVSLRLLTELDYGLAMRILDILQSRAMAGSPYYIPPMDWNGKKLRPVPTSPLVKLQDLADAEAAIAAVSELLQLMGPQIVAAIVDVEGFARWFLEYRGFPMHLIKKVEDAVREQAIAQRAAQQAQASQAAVQQQQQQGGAQGTDPAAQPQLAALMAAAAQGGGQGMGVPANG